MEIRRAGEKDLDMVLKLLSEVLEIHAKIRPDIFISGTTKYNREELKAIFRDEKTPVYVAVDEKDQVMGYAFCMIKNQPKSDNLVPYRSIYIDDLCVDESWRGHHVGEALFDFVREEARRPKILRQDGTEASENPNGTDFEIMCLFSLKNRAETGTNMPFSLEKPAGYDYNGNKESVLE